MGVKLRVLRPAGVMAEGGDGQIAGGFALHLCAVLMRVAAICFSTWTSATLAAAAWAAIRRLSPATSAMIETDLGADSVMSQPGRCSTLPPRVVPSCSPAMRPPAWRGTARDPPRLKGPDAPRPCRTIPMGQTSFGVIIVGLVIAGGLGCAR
jgi:hypothetical protein